MSRSRHGFRLTREGVLFVAVVGGVGLAAVNTGNNLLYLVLGLMLSLLLVSGTLSDMALWRLKVERQLPKRVFAGQVVLVEVRLHNPKEKVPAHTVEVDDLAPDEDAVEQSAFFLKVRPGEEVAASYRRHVMKRGVFRVEGFRLRTRAPFGLIEKSRFKPAPAEFLVYPALVPVHLAHALTGSEGSGDSSQKTGRSGDIQGLREYYPGDEARSIHWRKTAATGRLVVRERASESKPRLALLIDDAEPSDERDAWRLGFEHAISEAASLAIAAAEAGVSVEIVTRSGSSPCTTPGAPPDAILKWLALLQASSFGDNPPPLVPPRGAHAYNVRIGRKPSMEAA